MLVQPRFSSRNHKHIEQVMRRRERKYPFLTGVDLMVQIGLLIGMFIAVAIVGFLTLQQHTGNLSAQLVSFATKLLT